MSGSLPAVKTWIEKGDHDLGTARITHAHIPAYKDTIAIHCQQSVEKYLKARLVFLGMPVPRSHDLNYLLDLIESKAPIGDELPGLAARLQDYSVEVRYPDSTIELTEEDIADALRVAAVFRLWAQGAMDGVPPFDGPNAAEGPE